MSPGRELRFQVLFKCFERTRQTKKYSYRPCLRHLNLADFDLYLRAALSKRAPNILALWGIVGRNRLWASFYCISFLQFYKCYSMVVCLGPVISVGDLL